MKKLLRKLNQKTKRATRTRAKIRAHGTEPRLSVFRSNQNLYVQVIDDAKGVTLASASLAHVKEVAKSERTGRVAKAFSLGKLIAEKAKAKGVSAVVFDRGRYAYHGRVKAVADGAREGGLKF